MLLRSLHQDVGSSFARLSDLIWEHAHRWSFRPSPQRWTMAQHAEHLWLAGLSIASVLRQEDEFFAKFPALDRSPCSFAELKQRYAEAIRAGMKALPKQTPANDLQKTPLEFQQQWEQLAEKTAQRLRTRWNRERLEKWTVPHPALDIISVHELLLFKQFHIDHHIQTLEKEYLY